VRIVGLLSWYDEQPAWLAELVASMGRAGVDHLVAVDGAYGAYPDATGDSGSEQAAVVAAAALGAGMGVTVHQPQEPWQGNEIEKRTFLFAAAHLVARPGMDWLWIVDGDEIVTHANGLREQLGATDMVAATCTLWEGVASGEHEWNTQPLRMMFRAQASGIRVHGHHACYLTGDGQVLWDNWQPTNEVPALALPGVRVRHRPGDRPAYRNRKRNDYYNRSKSLGLEKMNG
jgi:hypothetical protein